MREKKKSTNRVQGMKEGPEEEERSGGLPGGGGILKTVVAFPK